PDKAALDDIDMVGLAVPFPHQPRSRGEARDLLGPPSGKGLARAIALPFELSTKVRLQGSECCHLDCIGFGQLQERSATAFRGLVAKPPSPSPDKFPAR